MPPQPTRSLQPTPQYDKFTSGSHSAKNAAGITRKQIAQQTYENHVSKLGYAGTKSALAIKIQDDCGKCLGTRTVTINGKKVHLPVYEKGGIASADAAMAYVAGFSGNDAAASSLTSTENEGDLVFKSLHSQSHTSKMTPAELMSWGYFRERQSELGQAAVRKTLANYVNPQGSESEDAKETEEDSEMFLDYFGELMKNMIEGKSKEEAEREKGRLLEGMNGVWQEFMLRRHAGRWVQKKIDKGEVEEEVTEGFVPHFAGKVIEARGGQNSNAPESLEKSNQVAGTMEQMFQEYVKQRRLEIAEESEEEDGDEESDGEEIEGGGQV